MLRQTNMGIKVTTFTKEDDLFLPTCKRINMFLLDEEIDHKRKKNYMSHRLKISDSIAVSIYEQDKHILGFSNIIHRDMFGNGCRILNRFYKSSNYRFAKQDMLLTKQMILDQINVCKNLNFSYVFMSRESNTGAVPFLHYLKKLNLDDWNVDNYKYHVCCNDEKCKQYVAWTALRHGETLQLEKVK